MAVNRGTGRVPGGVNGTNKNMKKKDDEAIRGKSRRD